MGFRKILVLNGHGGNQPGSTLLSEVVNDCPGLVCRWYSWWTSDGVMRLAQEQGLNPAHASWMEAFDFTRVAELPEGEKKPVEETNIMETSQIRQKLGDGVYGGSYEASAEIMEQMFDLCVKEIVIALDELQGFTS